MTGPTWPTLRVTVPVGELDHASGELWELGTTGIAEHPQLDGTVVLVAGFASQGEVPEASAALSVRWPTVVDIVEGAEWLDAWREHFPVTRIGRFVVVPSWKDVGHDAVLADPRPDDIILALDPGRAFGTGAHPSTALILERLPTLVRPGTSVLDVGCGSGVLAVAAALLGASHVRAIDVDDEAVRVTHANAQQCRVGPIVEADTTALSDLAGRYPVVLANILAPVLLAAAPHIAARVAPDGTVVLAGIIDTQVEEVTACYSRFGLRLDAVHEAGIWRSLTMHSPPGTSSGALMSLSAILAPLDAGRP